MTYTSNIPVAHLDPEAERALLASRNALRARPLPLDGLLRAATLYEEHVDVDVEPSSDDELCPPTLRTGHVPEDPEDPEADDPQDALPTARGLTEWT